MKTIRGKKRTDALIAVYEFHVHIHDRVANFILLEVRLPFDIAV